MILVAIISMFHPKTVSASCINPTAAKAIIQSNSSTITGTVKFYTAGVGKTTIRVQVTGLPPGPIFYHIHFGSVVGPDGKPICNAATVILNPLGVPNIGHCDPSSIKETCLLGDLSGIFGPIKGVKTTDIRVVHPFMDVSQTFGKSIVFHDNDSMLTRIACGNIRAMDVGPGGREIFC